MWEGLEDVEVGEKVLVVVAVVCVVYPGERAEVFAHAESLSAVWHECRFIIPNSCCNANQYSANVKTGGSILVSSPASRI